MGALFLIAYIVVGIAQFGAGIEGMQLTFGIGGFLAVVLLVIAYAIPIVGPWFARISAASSRRSH